MTYDFWQSKENNTDTSQQLSLIRSKLDEIETTIGGVKAEIA